MKLSKAELCQTIDLSAVKAEDDEKYIHSLVACAKKYRCIAVYPLPSQTLLVKELLAGEKDILLGGAVGFPAGSNTTNTKVFEAKELVSMGCQEIDMVINISKLRSGQYQEVRDDISAVLDACDGKPLKVILECHYLNDKQILKGCDLVIDAKANWVKTGTGWAPTGATLSNVALIKSHVGDAVGVKAAGGIRDLKTLLTMYNLGARRFGLGLNSSQKILEEAYAFPGEIIEF
jgi:deoxyribose-phosphate aldolase